MRLADAESAGRDVHGSRVLPYFRRGNPPRRCKWHPGPACGCPWPQTYTSGVFGTVTNKRVIYQRAKGWFSGGSREDIPLKHVTSVRLDITRHILGGALFALIGLSLFAAPSGGGKLIGAALTALAVLLLWGPPAVVVNTAGQDKNASRGWPRERGVAADFVEAVRKQLVSQ